MFCCRTNIANSMNEQQQLTFKLGLTNVPSDILCDDEALEESLGMTFENGEHKPIQKPVLFATIDPSGLPGVVSVNADLLYVHRLANQERYIVCVDGKIAYGVKEDVTVDNTTQPYIVIKGWLWNVLDGDKEPDGENTNTNSLVYTSSTNVTSVGKTLIINNDDGINYYLWKNEYTVTNSPNSWQHRMYSFLGNRIPEPKVEFRMVGATSYDDFTTSDTYCAKEKCPIVGLDTIDDHYWTFKPDGHEDWKNAVVGLYNKTKKSLWQKKLFFGSFCVRAVLKLYDDTYYMPTNPVLMLSTFDAECLVNIDAEASEAEMVLYGHELQYKIQQDYTQWNDIVKDITLFVTKENEMYDTQKDALIDRITHYGNHSLVTGWDVEVEPEKYKLLYNYHISQDKLYGTPWPLSPYVYSKTYYIVLERNPLSDMKKLIEDGVFYRLCDIGLTPNSSWQGTIQKIDSHQLENITTYDQLESDDYHAHCNLFPKQMFVYNKRLNLTGVSRDFFEGFDKFLPYSMDTSESSPTNHYYDCFVTISTDTCDYVIKHTIYTQDKQGIFFYYPDARAKHVVIKRTYNPFTIVLDADLKEHPSLNGAYYFFGIDLKATYDLPASAEDTDPHDGHMIGAYLDLPTVPAGTVAPEPTEGHPKELLPSSIITSEVNNPFEFLAHGYNDVGQGEVIGLSSNTKALSQGQHGQHPLLVFTTEGIWALSVNNEGLYNTSDPMSREVALQSNPCLTQTDSLVFFASKKGLMVCDGSSVTCVSEQLRGVNTFLEDAFIAYDYAHSLLWIVKKTYSSTVQPCYVYNLKTGTFSRYQHTQPKFKSMCNIYPDTLLCEANPNNPNRLFSLMNIPQEDSDATTDYSGELMSRPIKFGNGMALKSLRDLKVIRHLNSNAGTELILKASNDLTPSSWRTLKSFRGVPYKYFKIGLKFSNMKATDRFSGVIAITQERRTNKLR